jgi:hypothetical protein
MEARTRRAGGGGPGANTTTVEPPKFDGAIFWVVFRQQFEAAGVQNNWTPNEQAFYFLSVLQGQAAGILYTMPTEATYDGIVGAPETLLVTTS